ncbi:hypothetical protein [Bacillus sp. Bos-x628]|uniref:hypothetical protein n=1 Tax=Bacillus maqinnsis TaxID=3229854 RepID=UPI00338F375B
MAKFTSESDKESFANDLKNIKVNVLSKSTFVLSVKKKLDNSEKRVDNSNNSICEKIFTIGDVCIEGR